MLCNVLLILIFHISSVKCLTWVKIMLCNVLLIIIFHISSVKCLTWVKIMLCNVLLIIIFHISSVKCLTWVKIMLCNVLLIIIFHISSVKCLTWVKIMLCFMLLIIVFHISRVKWRSVKVPTKRHDHQTLPRTNQPNDTNMPIHRMISYVTWWPLKASLHMSVCLVFASFIIVTKKKNQKVTGRQWYHYFSSDVDDVSNFPHDILLVTPPLQ